MNFWSKLFLGFIFVLIVAVLVLAAVEGIVRGKGLHTEVTLQKDIADADAGIIKIKEGTAPQKKTTEKNVAELGFEELRSKLTVEQDRRGRCWKNCKVSEAKVLGLPPSKITAKVVGKEMSANDKAAEPLTQVEVVIVITEPVSEAEAVARPDALTGIVYAFTQTEQGTEPGSFLGRFTVNSSQPQQTKYLDDAGVEKNGYKVTLLTADSLSDADLQIIDDAKPAKWTLLLTCPKDVVETDLEKQQDFATALNYAYKQRNAANVDKAAAEATVEKYKEAEKKTLAENNAMETDIDNEQQKVAAMEQNRDAVNKTLQQYDAEIDEMRLKIEKMQILQNAYLAKIAEAQLQIKKKIEQDAAE